MLIMKDGKVGPARVKVSSSQAYTVAEIRELERGYIRGLIKRDGEIDPVIQIILDRFVEWVVQREKEQERQQ